MTQPTKQPSDPSTPDPWNDLDIVPTAPGKDHYQAQYLYNTHAKASEGMGVFAWVVHPFAMPLVLLGLVLLVGLTWYGNHQETQRQEAANAKALFDMASFKKAMAVQGLNDACLATPRDQVPHQYFGECQAVAKAHAAKKETRK